ncbi:response regulator [bacterium]|nr:response regulator [bacterium]
MSKVTLLVMDDEPAMGRLMQEVVGYLGFDVRVTPNAEDGLALAERLAPDLILLSLRMPGMEPARVCERLRTLEATAETPVLLLSNRPHSGDLYEEAATSVSEAVSGQRLCRRPVPSQPCRVSVAAEQPGAVARDAHPARAGSGGSAGGGRRGARRRRQPQRQRPAAGGGGSGGEWAGGGAPA